MLSIDIRGEWSAAQVRAIGQALAPELYNLGLDLCPVEVTAHGGPKRFMLLARCDWCREVINVERVTPCKDQPMRHECDRDAWASADYWKSACHTGC